jgi:integrase
MGAPSQAAGFGRTWSLREAQQWLGHRSITTTERYAHLAPEGLAARAAELHRESAAAHNTPAGG